MKKLKECLNNRSGLYSRTFGPSCYIFVQDNIDDKPNRKITLKWKGQAIQNEQYYLELFASAGLEL